MTPLIATITPNQCNILLQYSLCIGRLNISQNLSDLHLCTYVHCKPLLLLHPSYSPPPPTYILSSPSNLYPILSSIYISPGYCTPLYMNGLSTISSSSNKANAILSMLTILLMTQGGESKSMRGSQLNGFNWNKFILFLSANLHFSLGIILI